MVYHGMAQGTPLARRKPLRAKPRSKGNRAELEVREILRGHGYASSRRNFQSGGQGGGDLIEAIPGFHLEVKHHERTAIWEWIAQAEADARPTETPTVVFRRNRSRWYACIPFEDLLGLLREAANLIAYAVERGDSKEPLRSVAPAAPPSHGVVPLSGEEKDGDA